MSGYSVLPTRSVINCGNALPIQNTVASIITDIQRPITIQETVVADVNISLDDMPSLLADKFLSVYQSMDIETADIIIADHMAAGNDIAFGVEEIAGVKSTRYLKRMLDIPDESFAVQPYGLMSYDNMDEIFEGLKPWWRSKNDILITFHDDNCVSVNENGRISLPYNLLKLDIMPREAGRTISISKGMLNIPDTRKVIVAGSLHLNTSEMEKLINIYNQHFLHLPVNERPVLVLAPRHTDAVDQTEYVFLKNNDYLVRDERSKIQNNIMVEDMNDKDILFLLTQGELDYFYSVADIAILGYDRNIMEPLSWGKQVLYFGSSWRNNKEILDLGIRSGMAFNFSEDKLIEMLEQNKAVDTSILDKKINDLRITSEIAAKRAKLIIAAYLSLLLDR